MARSKISADGYLPCTTQIFPKDDPYLTTDSVFAVKDDLVIDFTPLEGDKQAVREMKLNLCLAPKNASHSQARPVVQ